MSRYYLNQALRYLLWIALPLLSLLAIYMPQYWPFKTTFKYARTATALYYATYRLAFVATFAWTVFECVHHRAGEFASVRRFSDQDDQFNTDTMFLFIYLLVFGSQV